MFIYSTYLKTLFWILMGLLYALMIVAAPVWARDLGFEMTWWKWLLSAGWYGLLSLGVAAGATLIGEKEPRAGTLMLSAALILMIVLSAGLGTIL